MNVYVCMVMVSYLVVAVVARTLQGSPVGSRSCIDVANGFAVSVPFVFVATNQQLDDIHVSIEGRIEQRRLSFLVHYVGRHALMYDEIVDYIKEAIDTRVMQRGTPAIVCEVLVGLVLVDQ